MLPEKNSKSKSKCGKNQDFIYRKGSTLSHETFRPVMQFLFFAIPYVFTQLSGLTDVYIMNAIDYDAFFLFFVKMVIKMVQVFSRGQTRIFFAVVISPWIQNEASSISDTLAGISSCINSTSTKITRKFRRQHWYAMRFQRTSLQIRVMH